MVPQSRRVTYVLCARESKHLHREGRNETRGKFDEVDLAWFCRALEREEITDDDDDDQVSCIAEVANEWVNVNSESCHPSARPNSPTENNAM